MLKLFMVNISQMNSRVYHIKIITCKHSRRRLLASTIRLQKGTKDSKCKVLHT